MTPTHDAVPVSADELSELRRDAERYNMLFRDTWLDGKRAAGIAIFRYERPHDDFARLGITEANEWLDALAARKVCGEMR